MFKNSENKSKKVYGRAIFKEIKITKTNKKLTKSNEFNSFLTSLESYCQR